jgi:hypothetical protein
MDMEPVSNIPERRTLYQPEDYDPTLNGIGGWLIVVIIGRILSIIVGIKDIGDVGAITVPSAYQWLMDSCVAFDLIVNIAMSIVILVLMFTKKKSFRIIFVVQAVTSFLFLLFADIYLINQGIDTQVTNLANPIVGGLIWITYLYKSKRVRNTFIYPYIDFEQRENPLAD